MESLKNLIPLSQAAKMTGYHQDYLGFLIRKGEIKAKKIGRAWFTTESEVKNYLFKQKVKQKGFSIWDFFSKRRARNIFFAAIVIAVLGFSVSMHIEKEKAGNAPVRVAQTTLSSEAEIMVEKKP